METGTLSVNIFERPVIQFLEAGTGVHHLAGSSKRSLVVRQEFSRYILSLSGEVEREHTL